MKILIIGGTALIGPHLIREIYTFFPKAMIYTLTRSGKNYFTEHALKADRNDKKRIQEILRDISPDILIDMIPFTIEDAECTASVIQEIVPEIPIIALSSIDVYAAYAKLHKTENVPYQKCPINEDMDLRKKLGAEGYKYDKLNIERHYISALSNLTILRLPAMYGWPDTTRVDAYLDPMLDGADTIQLSTQQAEWKCSRCLHKNASYAILKVIEAEQKGGHIYNVAEENAYSGIEWCKKIAALCGWKGRIILSADNDDKIDFVQDFYVSSEKIRKEIGYTEKYDPEEGLADTIAFHAYNRLGKNYKKYY